MKLFYQSILITLLSITSLYGQDVIKGVIVDAETQDPLPYTNIILNNSRKGTVSNSEGKFAFSIKNIDENDSLTFYFGGYSPVKVRIRELPENSKISLHPNVMNLDEVEVTDKDISPKDIVALIEDNFSKNYQDLPSHEDFMFVHHFGKVALDKAIMNPMTIKKSSFDGIDQETLNNVMNMMPDEFIDYSDVQLYLLHHQDSTKLKPYKAISLEESTASKAYDELSKKFEFLLDDMESTFADDDVYYRFKMGIISTKIRGDSSDITKEDEPRRDSTSFQMVTSYVKGGIRSTAKDYADIDSKNWEFITKRGKYKYEIKGVSMYDDDVVYLIHFTPKNGGLFKGSMYVSTETYAILSLDFEYAPDKEGRDIHLFGFGYTELFKKGRVIFQKDKDKYYLKYLKAVEHTSFSVERSFSILKKRKRFLVDKTMNEVKVRFNIVANSEDTREILVIERKDLTDKDYKEFTQPKKVKFEKVVTSKGYDWGQGTILEPTKELQEYKRKQVN
ncbi:carboxypeptidase-like regulatory domain-containing protein [Flammeovirga yaeyamensis]|uniref:Carboxypeptidase-like regulatory domain-containing protein n=1 Tax=Flammeovirga yaeyamensis TaxID=367791 RepID=A0AAX1NBV1_9BACT|nr:carboxypeptidase-like regulatory domain-containing protein [Flammeovirga yaeyamensis]MBB3697016.1 hypothetical protein [Flammeovirga yaeyamensis]NMF33679.1 carboxypeptidase-like regulatory domain-containing protein [Flammeovirga yaeyamensis]QWG05055.1 carboxypeptidase-like regulatory domain-containing protein [Flammeovirga yaeyamensis]